MLDYIHFPPYTEEPSKTEQGQFVWAGQKKIRYKQSSGILIPAPIQIIPLGSVGNSARHTRSALFTLRSARSAY